MSQSKVLRLGKRLVRPVLDRVLQTDNEQDTESLNAGLLESQKLKFVVLGPCSLHVRLQAASGNEWF